MLKVYVDKQLAGSLFKPEATLYMHSNAQFQDVGAVMLAQWNQGLNLSIQPEGAPERDQ